MRWSTAAAHADHSPALALTQASMREAEHRANAAERQSASLLDRIDELEQQLTSAKRLLDRAASSDVGGEAPHGRRFDPTGLGGGFGGGFGGSLGGGSGGGFGGTFGGESVSVAQRAKLENALRAAREASERATVAEAHAARLGEKLSSSEAQLKIMRANMARLHAEVGS